MSYLKNASNPDPAILPQTPIESPAGSGDSKEQFTNIELHNDEDIKDNGLNAGKSPEKHLSDEAKQNEVPVVLQDQDSDKEPPSMMQSPIARIKYDWEQSQNNAGFFSRVGCSLVVGMARSTYANKFPILSIAELIVGSIYLYDCPADPKIPEYLIVAGFLGTFLPLIPIIYKYLPNSTKDKIQSNIDIFNKVEAALQCFLFLWFIAGCVWVYSAYKPDFENTRASNYCFRGMYLFIFWLFNISFIIIILLITGICAIAIFVSRKATKELNEEE